MTSGDKRKERLQAALEVIEAAQEKRDQAGLAFKEIRDDELFKEDGFKTWAEYCRKVWDRPAREVNDQIKTAEYRQIIRKAQGNGRISA